MNGGNDTNMSMRCGGTGRVNNYVYETIGTSLLAPLYYGEGHCT